MRNSSAGALARAGLVTALLGFSLTAAAEPPSALANAQTALARAQGLLRQLNDQKQQLDIDNAKLKAANAGLEQDLKHAKLETADRVSELAARQREVEQGNTSLTHAKERSEQLTAKLKEVIAKYKDTARALKDAETERDQLKESLAAAQTELADAEKKNLALYQTNRDILEAYKKKPRWTAILQKEPFTGIKQVEIENKVEKIENGMLDQLRDSNLDAVTSAAAGGQ